MSVSELLKAKIGEKINHIGHFFEASGSASCYFYDLFTTLMGRHKKKSVMANFTKKSVMANFTLHPAQFQVHTKGPSPGTDTVLRPSYIKENSHTNTALRPS